MRKTGRKGMLLGLGALTMYFLDPQQGRRRRVMACDSARHCGYLSRRFLGSFGRDLRNRAEGAVAETRRLFRHAKVSDVVLQERIRSALGRVLSHPHAINVRCTDGAVEVSGQIMVCETDRLRRAIQSVPGARQLAIFAETIENSDEIAQLQARASQNQAEGLFGGKWSPTARFIVGSIGVGLIAAGLRRRSLFSMQRMTGAQLVARSVLNMPLRHVPRAGIRVEKTMRIHANHDEVFAFRANPENYAKVFSHVREIVSKGGGVYHWQVAGPAGVPVTWTGKVVREISGKLVEWRSLPGSMVENHGIVRMDEDGEYTRVHVQMEYVPPAGLIGHAFSSLLGLDPRTVMHHDVVRLQSLLERGITRCHGQKITPSDLGIAATRSREGIESGETAAHAHG